MGADIVMALNHVYCTYFDHSYLTRGLALYRSLYRYTSNLRLWVLCLSDECHQILVALDLPGIVAVKLGDFEAADPEVLATRIDRTAAEYYFTCTPAWMLFVLAREPSVEWLTYLDGDLFFFGSPETIYAELQGSDIAIIPHRYPQKLAKLKKFGTYNVGWVGVRNVTTGIAVIKWWRDRCIEWCRDFVDAGRFADQGYLDSFPRLPARVRVIANIGANLAPWNIENYSISFEESRILIDADYPLIFFHFQGLRKALLCFFFNNHRVYRAPFPRLVRNRIYRPYVDELLEGERLVNSVTATAFPSPRRRASVLDFRQYIKTKVRNFLVLAFRLLDIVTGRAFLVIRGKAY